METKLFLQLVRKNRWWVFTATILGFIGGFFIYRICFSDYTAQTILLINIEKAEQKGATESERYAFSLLNSVNMDRIYSLIYSDEMIQYLDKEYNLMSHYNISYSNEFKYNKLVKTVTSKINLYKESESVIKLAVNDYDAAFAAKLANGVAAKLIDMNLLFAQKVIEQKTELYNSMVNELTKSSLLSIKELHKSFTGIANIDYKNREPEYIKNFMEIQSKLDNTLANFTSSISDLGKINQVYALSLKAFENYKTTSIFILNKAYPDYDAKILRYLKAIALGIGVSILTFCLCCVSIYSYHKHKEHFAILFR